jgi:DegV family protein with EDD domain
VLPGKGFSLPAALGWTRRRGTAKVAVVTDSAAALPPAWLLEATSVRVLPLPVMIAGQIFSEGQDELSGPLSVALAEGAEVRTSRPSPGQFERIYRELLAEGYREIVSVHLSGALSGTVDAARWAANRASIPVTVVDSRTVAMAQGFGVMAASAVAQRGGTAAQAAAAAVAATRGSSLFFYVPDLDQLSRGGRIGPAARFLGSLLSVKPLLTVSEGKIVPLEKVRTVERALARLTDVAAADARVRSEPFTKHPTQIAVHHFGNRAAATTVAKKLSGAGLTQMAVSELPAVLAAHAGLGVVGVAVGDAIGEYLRLAAIPAATVPAQPAPLRLPAHSLQPLVPYRGRLSLA